MSSKLFNVKLFQHRKLSLNIKKTIFTKKLQEVAGNISKRSKSNKSSPDIAEPVWARKLNKIRNSVSKDLSPVDKYVVSDKSTPQKRKFSKVLNTNRLQKRNSDIPAIILKPCSSRNKSKDSLVVHKKTVSCATARAKSLEKPNDPFHPKSKDELIRSNILHFKTNDFELATTLQYYQVIDHLGQGSFGKVLLAIQILTNAHVALKVIEKAYLKSESSRRKVIQEIRILKRIQSSYVIKIYEYFETSDYIILVMEFMPGGDLLNYLQQNGPLPEIICKELLFQILQGVKSIHNNSILHRDLKLDNILLDKFKKCIKICDFGVSKFIKAKEIINEQCGTPAYLAPELILGAGYSGFGSDIWSLGVILYALFCGTVPFRGRDLIGLHKCILAGKYEVPKKASNDMQDIICKMLELVPSKRISLDDAVRHCWFDEIRGEWLKDHYQNKMINETGVRMIETFGYPRDYIIKTIKEKNLGHIFALYSCIVDD